MIEIITRAKDALDRLFAVKVRGVFLGMKLKVEASRKRFGSDRPPVAGCAILHAVGGLGTPC
jgi:hypothetical protein